MTKEQYSKNEIEDVQRIYDKLDIFGIPYIYDVYASDDLSNIRPSSFEELHNLLDKAVDIQYFSYEDCFDGGVIEKVAYQFDKKQPSDFGEDLDLRDYDSFILRDEETTYYVFFLDFWPKDDQEQKQGV